MAKIIITAKVEDAAKWEEGFRTHGDLLRSMTSTVSYFTMVLHQHMTHIVESGLLATTFAIQPSADNELTIYADVDDVDKYFEVMDSPATEEAMAFDGVLRDTVKVLTAYCGIPSRFLSWTKSSATS